MKKLRLLLAALTAATLIKAQVPNLNSFPTSQYVIYLDFDGEVVNNTNWSSSTINAASSGLTNSQIIEVFNRVAEKFRPFDVNITTSLSVYQAAASSKRMRVVLTTTSDWYGSVGGVAFIGSFGTPAYEPAWVFVNMLSYVPEYVADAAAHEVGHTLWLNHHGKYDANCNRTSTYHPGQGSGQTGWGPIMGAPYGYNMVLWYKGPTTSTTCAASNQDDLAVITANNGFTYRADDHGNSIATATNLNIINSAVSDSGIISTTEDSDFFKIVLPQTSNVTFNARPYSINPNTNAGANLHTSLTILNSSGTTLASHSPTTVLNSTLTINSLSPGTYYIKVDGIGVSNYNDYGGTGPNDYGSLGRYYLTGSITPTGASSVPTANFTSATSACSGETVSCTNTSTNNPTSFLWTCPGGTPTSATTPNASFTFNTAGTYTIKLKVTNASGSDSITKTITISAAPTLSSNVTSTAICVNASTNLTMSGANTYTWSPSTGLNKTTGASVTASPTSTLTYTIIGIAANGCSSVRNISVTVNAAPNVTGNNAAICSGASATLSVSGASTYSWSPANGLSATTGASVTASPTATTTYSIVGTASTGCTTLKTVVVTVNAKPTLTSSANTGICSGASATMTVSGANTYTWLPTTALSSSSGSSVIATPTTTTTYTVTGTNAAGCTASKTITITVNPTPALSTTANTGICSGASTTLSVSGANTYTWSPNTSISSTTATSITANPTSSITYTVTGTNTAGCTASKTISVTVNANPTLSGSSNTGICSGSSTTLTVSGANTYTWSPTTGLSNSTGTSTIANPTSSTTYTIIGTSTAGCTASRTVAVTVNSSPSLTTSNNASICSGQNTTMTVSGASTYSWSPSTGLSTTTGTSVIASPVNSTTYTVVGTSPNGCTSSKTITITVNPGLTLNASATTPSLCNGSSTAISATGATTYTWSPSTGLSATTGANITASPTITTTYTVTGVASGCTATSTVLITVNAKPTISSTANSSICSGNSITLNASGATTYTWSPSSGLSQTTGSSTIASPSTSVTYTIIGTSSAGCTNTRTVAITVNASPTITSSNNTSICSGFSTSLSAGGASTYTWAPATGLNNTTSSTVIASPTTSTTYTITGSSNGCSSTKTVSVTVNAIPEVSVSSSSIGLCNGTSAMMSASGANTYTWSPSTSLNTTTGASVITSATTNITYTVTGSSNGCSASKTIAVLVSPNFNLTSSPNTAICNGNVTTLSASGATSYLWTPSSGLDNITASTVSASPSITTTYTITGAKGNCVKTKNVVVTVNQKPSIVAGITSPLCSGNANGSITLTVGNATAPYTYVWSDGATTQNRTGLTAGTYTVTVTSANTCNNTQSIVLTNPSCTLPDSPSAQNIGTTTAQITWATQSCPVNYRLRYKMTSASTWTTLTFPATNSSYTLTGLTANSTYQYQMQSFCNSANTDSSGYTPVYTFTTLNTGGCSVTPTSLTVNNITASSAKLNWGEVGGAWGYKVRIRPSNNSAPYTEYTVQSPTLFYTVTGLSANTSYKWNVMTLCDAGGSNSSNWSTTSYFSTLGSGRLAEQDVSYSFDVNLFPNPTTGLLSCIIMSENSANVQIRLFDVMGRLMLEQSIYTNTDVHQHNIDITQLPAGMYLLNIRKENELLTYKIKKE